MYLYGAGTTYKWEGCNFVHKFEREVLFRAIFVMSIDVSGWCEALKLDLF
jgi:hypothetical protein